MAEAEATVYGPITDEIVARFLRCELEAYLETRKVIGSDREFADWRRQSRDRFKQAALVVLRSHYSDDEIHVGMPAAAALKQRRWRLIIDGIVETPMLRLRGRGRAGSIAQERILLLLPTDPVYTR